MNRFDDIHTYTDQIVTLVTDQILKPIAFQQFEDERGHSVRETLPDESEKFDFSSHGFEGFVDPSTASFHNPTYHGVPITTNRLCAFPDDYSDMPSKLFEAWEETFGENYYTASQPSHPGDPPITQSDLENSLESIQQQLAVVIADPLMEDLVGAIETRNYRCCAAMLNIDVDPLELFNPGGAHELTDLFTQGEIHIVYQDRDIALLKPEYNHDLRRQILVSQALNQRVREITPDRSITIDDNDRAFVVGIDDTPTGLFAHSVDGNNLSIDQEVSRSTIHDAMGFDYNYAHEEFLDCQQGDRIRLQGDLAVEYLGDADTSATAGRCNIPIDNHLAVVSHGEVPQWDSRETEPVTVQIPDDTTVTPSLNVLHDEHDNVAVELQPGEYRFYLLPRGAQPITERSQWPTPT